MLQKVNLKQKLDSISDHWNPRIAEELNGQHVKLVKIQGDFVWHHHDHEDEMFLVVQGRFCMQLRDGDIWLEAGEFIVVPKGVEHCPRADEECSILLFEPAETLNTGNVVNERSRHRLEQI